MPLPRRRSFTALLLGVFAAPGLLGCEARAPADPACPRLPAVTASAPSRGQPVRVAGADATAPGGSRRFVLTADTVFQLDDTAVIRLCGVRLVLLDSVGGEVARLRSERGDYEPHAEAITARERVVVEVAEGERRLLTDELHYSPREDRFWSPVRTTFQRPGVELRADSFTADGQFENVQAFAARGTFRWE